MLFPLLAASALNVATPPASPPPSLPASSLSVLSYNVHGLPWPIAKHRPEELRRIGETLAAMRARGQEPNIVLLQEAFTDHAKRISQIAGYPYAVTGPTRGDRLRVAGDDQQRQFVEHDHRFHGEHDGRFEDSGLLVLSDYPIVDVKRMAYPRYACAGYDCLANKGVVMVRVAVPGSPDPVDVIDTHMNSRGASGVISARSDLAYDWEAQSLRSFVAANIPPDAPAIVAGDLNVGKIARRLSDVTSNGGVLPGGVDAVRSAVVGGADNPDAGSTLAIARHNKDWMFGRSGARTELSLKQVTVPFGRDAKGHMLSDHMGYIATYRVEPKVAETSGT